MDVYIKPPLRVRFLVCPPRLAWQVAEGNFVGTGACLGGLLWKKWVNGVITRRMFLL